MNNNLTLTQGDRITLQKSGNNLVVSADSQIVDEHSTSETLGYSAKQTNEEIANPDRTIIAKDFEYKNMLNKDEWQNGYLDNGSFVSSDVNTLFSAISIEQKEYSLSVNSKVLYLVIYEFNNSDQQINVVIGENVNALHYVPKSNTSYIKVAFNIDNSTVITQAEIDSLNPQFSLYKKLIKDVGGYVKEDTTFYANDFKCKNMFNKYTVTKNYAVDGGSNGALIQSTGNSASDFIEVEPGKNYYLTKNPATGTSNCFYDSNKVFISAIYKTDGIITIPNNPDIKYIRFNVPISALDNVQFELGSTATTYTPYKEFDCAEVRSLIERFYTNQSYSDGDLNNAIPSGLYCFYPSILHRPSTEITGFADYGLIITFTTAEWYYQIAIGNYGTPKMAVRISADKGSTWGSWETV